MNFFGTKGYNTLLQLSILGLTWALAWFAFIYYPKIISNYKTGNVASSAITNPVSATTYSFPIATTAYTINFDEDTQTYYAQIEGKNQTEFVVNKDNANLAIKTALSLIDLCEVKIVYSAKTNIPSSLLEETDC